MVFVEATSNKTAKELSIECCLTPPPDGLTMPDHEDLSKLMFDLEMLR